MRWRLIDPSGHMVERSSEARPFRILVSRTTVTGGPRSPVRVIELVEALVHSAGSKTEEPICPGK